MLIGDHPPEISIENTVRDMRLRGTLSPCLVLRTTVVGNIRGNGGKRFRRLGVAGVLPKRDPARVLEEVQKAVA
jgi:hypothetical protein